MPEYLFSYGTLQPEYAPAEIALLLVNLPRVGRGWVQGILYDFVDYPGLALARGGREVWGQVFSLPEDPGLLPRLDDYEGFNPKDPEHSLFVRTSGSVMLESGKQMLAWIYVYNRDPGAAQIITSGDYAAYRIPKSL